MTDALSENAKRRAQVRHSLTRRNRAERRFRMIGLGCVLVAMGFVAILFGNILSRGLPAFFQHRVQVQVTLAPEVIRAGLAQLPGVDRLSPREAAHPEHTAVELLSYEEIAERRFAGWAMGQVDMSRLNPALLLKYSEQAEFNPFNASGHATMALLTDLLATGAIANRASG